MDPQRASLVALCDPAPVNEEEFNDWYDLEHIPQRMGLPGWLSHRRWVAVADGPKYLTTYELESLEALETPDYLTMAGSHYTPWSKRMMHKARIFRRLVCEQFAPGRAPEPEAGALLMVLWKASDDTGELFRTWLANQAVPGAAKLSGVCAGRSYTASRDESNHLLMVHLDHWRSGIAADWDRVLAFPAALRERVTETDRLVYRTYNRAE